MADAYRVKMDDEGCATCGRGVTWTVVGPDDVAQGVSFSDEPGAWELAQALNGAHETGMQAAFQVVGRRAPGDRRKAQRDTIPPDGDRRKILDGRRYCDDGVPF